MGDSHKSKSDLLHKAGMTLYSKDELINSSIHSFYYCLVQLSFDVLLNVQRDGYTNLNTQYEIQRDYGRKKDARLTDHYYHEYLIHEVSEFIIGDGTKKEDFRNDFKKLKRLRNYADYNFDIISRENILDVYKHYKVQIYSMESCDDIIELFNNLHYKLKQARN